MKPLLKVTWLLLALMIAAILSASLATAAGAQSEVIYPTYVVQTGDTLFSIAIRFNTTLNEIVEANQISDPNALNIGTELKIPSFPGVSGQLVVRAAGIGDTLESLAVKYHTTVNDLIKINRLASEEQVYIGSELIILDSGSEPLQTAIVASSSSNEPLLSLAARENTDPWLLLLGSSNDFGWALPAHFEFIGEASSDSQDLAISMAHLPALQGATLSLTITSPEELNVTAALDQQQIHFAKVDGNYQGLLGINARETAGLKTLSIRIQQGDEVIHESQQKMLVSSQIFSPVMHLTVDPQSISDETIASENAETKDVFSSFDSTKRWQTKFQYPLDDACIRAWYGGERVYNGTYTYYHSGIDFGICADNLNIYAPAPGVVVATGESPIKGRYTIISHGLGVFSGYMHQEEIKVSIGDPVTPGQLIGIIGNTGRSTGAHLHWEMWVNGISVDPLYWVEQDYP